MGVARQCRRVTADTPGPVLAVGVFRNLSRVSLWIFEDSFRLWRLRVGRAPADTDNNTGRGCVCQVLGGVFSNFFWGFLGGVFWCRGWCLSACVGVGVGVVVGVVGVVVVVVVVVECLRCRLVPHGRRRVPHGLPGVCGRVGVGRRCRCRLPHCRRHRRRPHGGDVGGDVGGDIGGDIGGGVAGR